jgi:GTPase SAR1 family protein
LTADAVRRLLQDNVVSRFLAVIGDDGAGKSSLI